MYIYDSLYVFSNWWVRSTMPRVKSWRDWAALPRSIHVLWTPGRRDRNCFRRVTHSSSFYVMLNRETLGSALRKPSYPMKTLGWVSVQHVGICLLVLLNMYLSYIYACNTQLQYVCTQCGGVHVRTLPIKSIVYGYRVQWALLIPTCQCNSISIVPLYMSFWMHWADIYMIADSG